MKTPNEQPDQHLCCFLRRLNDTSRLYRKSPKFWDTQNIAVNILKFKQIGLTAEKMPLKDADEIANSENPDQTAPGAV